MKRRAILLLVFGAAMPLAVASTAWACGVLATLTLNSSAAAPGQTLTATGKNYSSNPTASQVQVHLMTRSGAVVATTTPDSSGRISTSFQVPAGTSPGWYVVMATQYNANGTPKAGTPGRTSLRVQGSGAASRAHKRAAAVSPWSSAKPTGPAGATAVVTRDGGGSGGPVLLPLLLALVLSLSVLAGGFTLATRRSRTASRPQLGV